MGLGQIKNRAMLSLLFVMLLLGAGCSRETQSTPQEEKITLTFMLQSYGEHTPDNKNAFQKVYQEFPNVSIQVQVFAEEQYYTALKARLASGDAPDFFHVQPGYAGTNGVNSLAEAGYLAPIDDLECVTNLKASGDTSALLTYGDHIYSISSMETAVGVVYNKKVFRENGLAIPQYWEDFLKTCQHLKEQGIQPLILGGKDMNSHQYGPYQIAVNRIYRDEPDFDEKLLNGETTFTQKESWDEVLSMYTDLYKLNYIEKNTMLMTVKEASARFRKGEAAMIFATLSEAAAIMMPDYASGEYGFFPLPANRKGEPTFCCIGKTGGIGIHAGTEYPELCKKIANIFLSDIQVWNMEDMDSKENPFYLAALAYKEGNYSYLCNQGWKNEVEIVLEKKLAEYITGGNLEIQDITEAMQQELEK